MYDCIVIHKIDEKEFWNNTLRTNSLLVQRSVWSREEETNNHRLVAFYVMASVGAKGLRKPSDVWPSILDDVDYFGKNTTMTDEEVGERVVDIKQSDIFKKYITNGGHKSG